ncbi:unnamed protein product [Oikopleura dioica]|uniref:Uncharacterized protein n=1 Tax=Oikopleura dioica TaxID=34765 RepID=E4Y0X2_OIKDI|nr:unnamed protein product [Oikopleura dioica]
MIIQLLIACCSLAFGAKPAKEKTDAIVEDFPLIDFFSTRDNYSCIDNDLGNLCDTECRVVYIGCRQECTEIYCENACVSEYSNCLSDCPCGLNCPEGCEGCAHPLCTPSPCEDLDNNADYQRCKKQLTKELNECLDDCKNSLLCIDECTDEYKRNIFVLGFEIIFFLLKNYFNN